MSSVPKIAVALASGPPADPPPRPPGRLHVVPPLEFPRDALLRAALDAEDEALPLASLSMLWADYVEGRFRLGLESMHPDRTLLVSYERAERRRLPAAEESILRRILCGEQQKALAFELDLGISTLSTRYNRALRKLDIERREVPVALVLAAQCAAGIVPCARARSAAFEHQTARCSVVSVRRPDTERLVALSRVEQQVAAWVIEGCSRREMAGRRGSSKHTVSRHLQAIFRGLQVSGRYALIRRAAELGCFQDCK